MASKKKVTPKAPKATAKRAGSTKIAATRVSKSKKDYKKFGN